MLFIPIISTAQLNFEWAKSIGGSAEDRGYKMVTDAAANSYVTGGFSNTVDFDPGPGVTNLVSTGGLDIHIEKLNANGDLIWAKSIGSTLQDGGHGIAVDTAGNVYVTGFFQGSADFDPGVGTYTLTSVDQLDAFVVKLDANGNFVWAMNFGSTTFDNGLDITIDHTGNVLVCGYFTGTADFDPSPLASNTLTSWGGNDVFILKLNSQGNYIWAKKMGGTGTDIANEVVVDGRDNIYTVGRFSGSADFDPGVTNYGRTSVGLDDVFVSKLDSAGNFIWAKSFGSTNVDYGWDIALDALNNVYTTGQFRGSADFDPGPGVVNFSPTGFDKAFISKLDSNGIFVWAKVMFADVTVSGNNVIGHGIYATPAGDVWCTGSFNGNVDFDPGTAVNTVTSYLATMDAFALKLNSGGDFMNLITLGQENGDVGTDIYENNTGIVTWLGYYSGTIDFNPGSVVYSMTSNGGFDMFFSKFNSLPATPGSVSGLATICSGTTNTYSVAAVSGATSYNWTLPGGWAGTSSTNSITATSSATSGIVSVEAVNSFGTTPASSQSVTVNSIPALPDAISGLTAVCSGTTNTYSVNIISDATSYNWTFPVGWTGGGTSNSVSATASLNGGMISVSGVNLCGTSPVSSLAISANPSYNQNISATICNGSTYTLGSQTLSATGNYTETFTSISGCDSVVNLTLSVNTVNTGTSVIGNVITANAVGATYQWIDCNNGNSLISGQTGISYTVSNNGVYAVIINSNGCIDTSTCVVINGIGLTEVSSEESIIVYPNPNNGIFTISMPAGESCIITNVMGQIIKFVEADEKKQDVNILGLASGVYYLVGKTFKTKIVVSAD